MHERGIMSYITEYRKDVAIVMSEFEPRNRLQELAMGTFAVMVVHQARRFNIDIDTYPAPEQPCETSNQRIPTVEELDALLD